ncbi:hypothetical protein [Herbaspirillum huttiense]|uniref:hypothetical protein n=1 Tax=Herbaspirillum huttiense TaxID=863372 RepID=UPI0012FE9AD5|nr:hypothetical protein [Herbaspirillum huttiense]
MAPNNTAEQSEFANVRLLVARHVLPAFFVSAQNHYQRKDISRSDLSRFIRQYSPGAMIDFSQLQSIV